MSGDEATGWICMACDKWSPIDQVCLKCGLCLWCDPWHAERGACKEPDPPNWHWAVFWLVYGGALFGAVTLLWCGIHKHRLLMSEFEAVAGGLALVWFAAFLVACYIAGKLRGH